MPKIIVDTREQKPWEFINSDLDVISHKLSVGDYSLDGHEADFCIERKSSAAEIYTDMTKERTLWMKKIERMSTMKYSVVLLEFPYNNILSFPVNSGIPKKMWPHLRMKSSYLIKMINKIQDDYGVPFIFADDHYEAEEKALSIIYDYLSSTTAN